MEPTGCTEAEQLICGFFLIRFQVFLTRSFGLVLFESGKIKTMSGDLKNLVDAKNAQRAALKKEFYKLISHPEAAGQGHAFDPALQRYLSMRVTRVDFFRETPRNVAGVFALAIIPIAATIYFFKTKRDEREALYRSGAVAYSERQFKFT
ncbi:NADH-ubiquinone oxidoreductase B15 subunit (NDUFB4) [Nesidiocoris tenuis]|uniref:NADH dehydrogenase [ubiquinone] 1 beta subcomplex subunit 4 n=1 Tax=Nesidiocoris tenuis TaxID=355587 RepID=A0ABN7B8I0_9HEMI|nr:NADH-ubiquinone oxidoreductase B15 subunit (NDUFB4) [Nesidiocoris tenuis]